MGDINENFMKESKFGNFMKEKGLLQMVNRPTCETGSLLDHIYVNDAMDKIGFCTQIDSCYYSDHDIVTLYVSK